MGSDQINPVSDRIGFRSNSDNKIDVKSEADRIGFITNFIGSDRIDNLVDLIGSDRIGLNTSRIGSDRIIILESCRTKICTYKYNITANTHAA